MKVLSRGQPPDAAPVIHFGARGHVDVSGRGLATTIEVLARHQPRPRKSLATVRSPRRRWAPS